MKRDKLKISHYHVLNASKPLLRLYAVTGTKCQNAASRELIQDYLSSKQSKDGTAGLSSGGKLHTSVYRKDTNTDQYLLFHSHHPLVHKLGVIKTDTICSAEVARVNEHKHSKSALDACG